MSMCGDRTFLRQSAFLGSISRQVFPHGSVVVVERVALFSIQKGIFQLLFAGYLLCDILPQCISLRELQQTRKERKSKARLGRSTMSLSATVIVEPAMRPASAVIGSYVGRLAAMVVSHFIVCGCSLTDRVRWDPRMRLALLWIVETILLCSLKSVSPLKRTCAEVKLTRAHFIVLFADFKYISETVISAIRSPQCFSPNS